MKLLNTIALVIFSFSIYGQNEFILKINVKGLPGKVIYLADFYGDKNKFIDTTVTNAYGTATFVMNDSRQPGMYHIVFDKDRFADVIYNREDITVSTVASNPMDSLVVESSTENKIYYGFLHYDQEYELKDGLLNSLVEMYPRKEAFYKQSVDEYNRVQKDRDDEIARISASYPDAFATKFVKLQKLPYIDPAMKESDRFSYLKLHFFDYTDFNDVNLLRSDAYTNKVINYLKLYSNRQLNQAQLEDQFRIAVDIILESAAKGNRLVYDYIVDYLTRGFEKFGFDKVNLHIAEKYKEQSACENEARKSDLQTRLENYQKLAEGKIAPEFEIPDDKGNKISMASVKTDYTVLLFWASWCPHCASMLPDINTIYESQTIKKFEIIAYSLDNEEADWRNALAKGNFTWISCCDFKGWNSKISVDYNIYATPTMYVLDKNRKIIAKPITPDQLRDAVKLLK
ncbi:MAG: thioredoxin-like domain-containing protein [Bacteroidia bacterium]|nr:thioredoxin-like domain-containing protein [Bacteroidia bacterium]